MQGARNGPRINEDLVGPRHWVAGGPVGYKHGMRDEMRARGQDRGVARAAQQPLGITIGSGLSVSFPVWAPTALFVWINSPTLDQ